MKGYRQPGTLKAAILLAMGLGLSKLAMAVGLGPIQVNSYMGQPLKASIKINGISDAAAASSVVRLADTAAYRARGIVKTPEQSGLTFSIVKSGNSHTILVRSNSQIREPFINFILSMKSGGQEITREYAVFLNPDPAVQAGIAPAPTPVNLVETQPATTIQPANANTQGWGGRSEKAKPVALNTQANTSTAAQTAAAHASSYQGGNIYGPVKPGETLYSIAKATRHSEAVSVDAMMRAIFKANRRAFASNSLSSLMVGYTLTIPSINGAQPQVMPVEKSKKSTSSKPTVAEARKNNQKATQTAVQNEPSSNEEGIAEHSEIAPVLKADHSADEQSIIPAEMSEEEIAAAKAEADAKRAEAELPIETSSSDVTSEMQLDAPDSLDTSSLENTNTAEEIPTEEKKALTIESEPTSEPAPTTSTPSAEEVTPVKTIPTTTVEPAKPATTTDNTFSNSDLPFGLPLWQLLILGGGILLLLLLVIFALLAKRRKKPSAEITEEELEALTKELETSAEGKLLANALSNEVILEKTPNHLHHELPLENEYAQVDDFFSEKETSDNNDANFQDLDDFFSTADEQDKKASAADAHQHETFNALDDFFAEESNVQNTASEEPVDFDGLEDFFAVSTDEQAQHSEYTEQTTTSHSVSDFDALDDFFAEPANEQKTTATHSNVATDTTSSSNLDNLDDFFAVSDEKSAPANTTTKTSTEHQVPDFNGLDDFFAETDETSLQKHTTPESDPMDIEEDLFMELEEEPNNTVSNIDSLDDFSSESPTGAKSEMHQEATQTSIDEMDFFNDFATKETAPIDKASVKEELPSAKSAVEITPADIQAMDINLDLAVAYIKSGVKPEKAKMWLNEVLEKGTEEQRKVAEDLLKQLG
ncbi:FimV/HubP family polar landmark protein [Suttonella ornithocola]|uniref:Tfp pilus assembly protein FimV n=1 Tax=Suttonella ornithocola TaxID=279832 RepID=A0A380MZ73_9GAMM|nr:FimV/HubP family polar landmark protein [Suttonella ornithocola]SUO97870.1 Tfp pilus assembly protein FimV [Suttonella ornithocola]